MAGRLGFEPRLDDLESTILPLEDRPARRNGGPSGSRTLNSALQRQRVTISTKGPDEEKLTSIFVALDAPEVNKLHLEMATRLGFEPRVDFRRMLNRHVPSTAWLPSKNVGGH